MSGYGLTEEDVRRHQERVGGIASGPSAGRKEAVPQKPSTTAPKQSKYRNKKVKVGGAVFDSQGEYGRWCELELLEKSGVISGLRRQVPFVVIPPLCMDGRHVQATTYRADFVYQEAGAQVVEDWKGVRTEGYLLKRKLMFHVHGIVIRETGK